MPRPPLPRLRPSFGPDTRVVTLQNGIDSKAMVARHVPAERIAAGAAFIGAEIRAPGVIAFHGGAHRFVVDSLAGDPVLAAFFAAGERAPALDLVPTDDAEHTLWEKFVALAAFSGVTALTRCPLGAVHEHPESLAFMRSLMAENLAVARASGQEFPADHADGVIAFFNGQPYGQKSSMLMDLEAGKPLELPWLSGRVAELGRQFAIPTPASDAVVAALAPHVAGRTGK